MNNPSTRDTVGDNTQHVKRVDQSRFCPSSQGMFLFVGKVFTTSVFTSYCYLLQPIGILFWELAAGMPKSKQRWNHLQRPGSAFVKRARTAGERKADVLVRNPHALFVHGWDRRVYMLVIFAILAS